MSFLQSSRRYADKRPHKDRTIEGGGGKPFGSYVALAAAVLTCFGCCCNGNANFHPVPLRPGRWIYPTLGEIWPKPQMQKQDHKAIFSILPGQFQFKLQSAKHADTCEVLVKGVERITKRMFVGANDVISNSSSRNLELEQMNEVDDDGFFYAGPMNSVELILLTNPGDCTKIYPKIDDNENYEIKVDSPDSPGKASIVAITVWGLLRGMESFSHLVYQTQASKGIGGGGAYLLQQTTVNDFPRFPFRGFMIDTSRHFLPKATILETLDLMEMNKLNALHWHLTDDPSFPYQSKTFPNLSGKGAFSQRHVYTQQDVADVIEDARIRGIRVIPEFDTPGHTQSWGLGHPEVLTKCGTKTSSTSGSSSYFDAAAAADNGIINLVPENEVSQRGSSKGSISSQVDGGPLPEYGPVNPIKNSTYEFMAKLFEEISQVFPDPWLHLGGDEVDKSCWMSNQEIVNFMEAKGWTNYNKLESIYIEKLIKIVRQFSATPLVWQEVFDDGDNISKDTIVHIWKGGWQDEAKKVTDAGFNTIISSPFYLNIISYNIDWPNYYKVDITDFGASAAAKHLVKGGEVCLWGEFINFNNLISISWPRASAVAERLWSSQSTNDVSSAAPRLEEHACRMQARGHMIQPASGPGFC